MVRFGVLGPLAAWTDDGAEIHVAEPKVRALLAGLLAAGGGPVSADRLIDDLWGDRPTRNPVGTLQARVSQLRRALGDPAAVLRGPAGYRLAAHDSDAARFRALADRRGAAPRERARELDQALALWRGPAYADFADEEFARPEIALLEELRLSALEEQAEVRLALGADVDLAALVARHPLRERLRASHMKALYRGGRQSEALAAYEELRVRLAEELGLDPSPELAALHGAILRQDPGLSPPPPPSASNLPAPLTGLIGRDADLAEVIGLLADSRLVTLTGSGGVGKTRLALAAARRLAFPDASDVPGDRPGGFADGVWLVELAASADVAEAVAAVLGVRDDDSVPLPSRLAGVLAGRDALLVLDNCEHLVEQVAALVSVLLRSAPGLRVLATSQEPLGVSGERVRVVHPLPEPDAVRLFAARADVEPGPTVGVICRRLDGIPLALELAATRVRALGVQELAARLDDRFRLLSAGMRDAPARQRTLRATIDWSWELLSADERAVLRRLAVHADRCTLEAAEAVCAEPGVDVLDVLARLVDRSLVVVARGPRYRLLESVTAYCLERLREAGEHDLLRERHAHYYTELAARAELRGPRQHEWLDRLDAESANLRLALSGPEALRLANALAWYWILRGRLREARRSLAAALAAGGEESAAALASVWLAGIGLLLGEPTPPVRRSGLDRAGAALADWFLSFTRWAYGDHAAHRAAAGRALEAYEELGDRWGTAAALCLRAKLAVGRGELAAMERDGERGLAIFRELGDEWGQVEAMDVLDRLAEIRGDYERAARLRREGLRLAERLGFDVSFKLAALGRLALLAGDYEGSDDYHGRARRLAVAQAYRAAEENALLGLAMSARRQGRYEEAESYLLPALDWLRKVRGTPGVAFVMAEWGFVAEQRGDAETALSRQREGYGCARATGDPRAVALALEGLAGALSIAGPERLEEAARTLGTAAAIRRSVPPPLPAGERVDVDRITARLRAALGEHPFERSFAAGEEQLGDHLAQAAGSGEGELGDHFPGALGGRARVEPAAQRLHPLGHADQPEPAAQPGHPRI
ncbi:BTAD domain-containing putative transcriptional regulator [Nonomuraea sp. WAC 01424]|uniref:BTAD domain-containing putative transcriptional regulator n=1 Tax=Nonomuraea sp. WAC 01424 TaxID=2203200 RepID=UPI0026C5C413|nr:BTAD domain-containing putative transcriptional regulator [Nonomuraea sp. WAC 01424]